MTKKKSILAIVGSASQNSSSLSILKIIAERVKEELDVIIYDRLAELPHFNPKLSIANTPDRVLQLRDLISKADGILICTPEYVFSIPSGLKNAIEWCVSTTVLSNKPMGLITASSAGEKAHEELQLIMRTVEGKFNERSTLLIRGVKSKVDMNGVITDAGTQKLVHDFCLNFVDLVCN